MAANIRKQLPKDQFVKVWAKPKDGVVLYVNCELARAYGFKVPDSNKIDDNLKNEILSAFSLEPTTSKEQRVTTLYADKHHVPGHDLVLGSGRAAYDERGLMIKGFGPTPLVHTEAPITHRHGNCPLRECIKEAIWGNVSQNLFTHGGTEVLAVIDLKTSNSNPETKGGHDRHGIVVRANTNLRPAHFISSGWLYPETLDVQLFKKTLALDDDVSIEDLIDSALEAHAKAYAEFIRFRVIHGALNYSNMGMFAEMLDFGTTGTVPRTSALHVLPPRELYEQVQGLFIFLSSLQQKQSKRIKDDLDGYFFRREGRSRLQILNFFSQATIGKDITDRWKEAVRKHKNIMFLKACGFKQGLAEKLNAEHCELCTKLRKCLMKMGKYTNLVDLEVKTHSASDAGVADIFNLLAHVVNDYFQGGNLSPENICKYLKIQFNNKGVQYDSEVKNEYYIKDKEQLDSVVVEFCETFPTLYLAIFEQAKALAIEFYPSDESFECSVKARAHFENQATNNLENSVLHHNSDEMIAAYEAGELGPKEFQAYIEDNSLKAIRNVDALLSQGQLEIDNENGVLARTQIKVINGVEYSIVTYEDGQSQLQVVCPKDCEAIVYEEQEYQAEIIGNHNVFHINFKTYDICNFKAEVKVCGHQQDLPRYLFVVPDEQEIHKLCENKEIVEKKAVSKKPCFTQ